MKDQKTTLKEVASFNREIGGASIFKPTINLELILTEALTVNMIHNGAIWRAPALAALVCVAKR
uniref:Uncharacterized protein n=1 Tax=Nelumbo nucifera TaxID=4432 RepID=A0A822YWL5_NELNU|nr:TPA_asm: hypothetical protein HUJ06_005786 [Nelumbo nucifera]